VAPSEAADRRWAVIGDGDSPRASVDPGESVPPLPQDSPSARQVMATLLELGADALRFGVRAATGRGGRQPDARSDRGADVDEALPATAHEAAVPDDATAVDDAVSGYAVAAATAQSAAAAAVAAALAPPAANEPSPADGETAAARIDAARERLRARIVAPADEDQPPRDDARPPRGEDPPQPAREREEGP
jgi:hypothetical protein